MPHSKYFIGNKEVPSVTQITGILDNVPLVWAAKMAVDKYIETNNREDAIGWPKKYVEDAATTGTRLHNYLPNIIKREKIVPASDDDNEIIKALCEWRDWNRAVGYRSVGDCFELKVISKDYEYGGTLDAVLKIRDYKDPNKQLWVLVDWKFTKAIRPKNALQLAGYAQALREQEKVKLDLGLIVRPYFLQREAKKTEKIKIKDGYKYSFSGSRVYIEERQYWELYDFYLQPFLALKEVYDYVNGLGQWEE